MSALIGVDYWACPYGGPPGTPTANHGGNGLWLHYTWCFRRHADREIDLLAQRLPRCQFR